MQNYKKMKSISDSGLYNIVKKVRKKIIKK